jgi:hypothetical protein
MVVRQKHARFPQRFPQARAHGRAAIQAQMLANFVNIWRFFDELLESYWHSVLRRSNGVRPAQNPGGQK